MMKKQNSEITCPYKSANVNRSPQQLQSFSTPPIRQIVKHGLEEKIALVGLAIRTAVSPKAHFFGIISAEFVTEELAVCGTPRLQFAIQCRQPLTAKCTACR
jgi:hypothetical protein